nr:MAG TPA: hypothetical protein [Caudoviricetes sp.]
MAYELKYYNINIKSQILPNDGIITSFITN